MTQLFASIPGLRAKKSIALGYCIANNANASAYMIHSQNLGVAYLSDLDEFSAVLLVF